MKLICNTLYYAFNELSWTAHDKLESELTDSGVTINDILNSEIKNVNIDIGKLIPTLKIAAQYVAHKNMRRAFSKFWSSSTDHKRGNELPASIKILKYHLRKGFYNILNITPEIVSLCCIYVL